MKYVPLLLAGTWYATVTALRRVWHIEASWTGTWMIWTVVLVSAVPELLRGVKQRFFRDR